MIWWGFAAMAVLFVLGARRTRADRNWRQVMRQWQERE